VNQAIQILDGASYIAQTQSLRIEALYQGQLIPCFLTGADEQTLLAFYASHQFDIEEHLEAIIEEENFDGNGAVQLTMSQVS
jgi:hypothetical protein